MVDEHDLDRVGQLSLLVTRMPRPQLSSVLNAWIKPGAVVWPSVGWMFTLTACDLVRLSELVGAVA